MDIFNSNKLKSNIRIVVFVFITFSRCSVGHCIQPGPGVHDVHEAVGRGGFADGLKQVLILQAPGAEARQRLTAPANGRLLGLMVVGQDREATLAAELGTAHNDGFARYPRNVEVPGVSLANLVVAVGIRQLPVGIGQPHPLVLLSQVQELPASLPFRLILLGIIREGVQIFVFSSLA